jgi:hypothetical protein
MSATCGFFDILTDKRYFSTEDPISIKYPGCPDIILVWLCNCPTITAQCSPEPIQNRQYYDKSDCGRLCPKCTDDSKNAHRFKVVIYPHPTWDVTQIDMKFMYRVVDNQFSWYMFVNDIDCDIPCDCDNHEQYTNRKTKEKRRRRKKRRNAKKQQKTRGICAIISHDSRH